MRYKKGNVINKSGIRFKDTGEPDPKGRHPAMIAIPLVRKSQYMYYLTLTSKVDKYVNHPQFRDKYALVKRTPYNLLRKSSLVNLANIYKDQIASDRPVAFIQPDEYDMIMARFKSYQTKHPDEYYEEIKDLI